MNIALSGLQIRDQYENGGYGKINPVDGTSFVASLIATTALGSSWLGFNIPTVSFIGKMAGGFGLTISVGQLWNNVYKPMNDLKYAPSYIDHNGQSFYGDPVPSNIW